MKGRLWINFITTICAFIGIGYGHTALDFDDSTHYKIEFATPIDFNPEKPELSGSLYDFYTREKEKYQCLVVEPGRNEDDDKPKEDSTIPIDLLLQFNGPKCLHRIETYWSYEICHGQHVLQYHEEREGKFVNTEEYYLGRWTPDDTEQARQKLRENHKAGVKYDSIKIDNINYPYFEMVMTGGTVCDITNTPRVTVIRYVCYTHSKGVIYSIKETSSCNYEAIILTSQMCSLSFLHPKEEGKIDVKCFNSLTKPTKPLTMLRQELEDIQMKLEKFSALKRLNDVKDLEEGTTTGSNEEESNVWHKWDNGAEKLIMKFINLNELDVTAADVNELVRSPVTNNDHHRRRLPNIAVFIPSSSHIAEMQPLLDFVEGKNCLTGGTGWWKYEFCYGKYVKQFHKDKKSDVSLYLGHFHPDAHREWLEKNPEKKTHHRPDSNIIWYHYEQGTICDLNSLPREVDVKLTCTPPANSVNSSPATTSMYLLEPKSCQYILVFESPMVCHLLKHVDENGLISAEGMSKLRDFSLDFTTGTSKKKPDDESEAPLRSSGTVEQVSDDSVTEIPPPLHHESSSADKSQESQVQKEEDP